MTSKLKVKTEEIRRIFLDRVYKNGCEVASQDGVGYWIMLSARSFRLAEVFAGVVLFSAIGLATGLLLTAAKRRLPRWQGVSR